MLDFMFSLADIAVILKATTELNMQLKFTVDGFLSKCLWFLQSIPLILGANICGWIVFSERYLNGWTSDTVFVPQFYFRNFFIVFVGTLFLWLSWNWFQVQPFTGSLAYIVVILARFRFSKWMFLVDLWNNKI